MPEVATSIANRPTWADLASPDIEATKEFYSTVFGWSAQQIGGPETGNYTFFLLGDKQVCGAGSVMDPSQHPAWTVYIGTDDIQKSAQMIRAAGGEVVMEPMDVMGAGQMCIFKDPTGAIAALWQAGTHKGAELMQAPGTMAWIELETRDIPKAKQFYNALFGWGEKTTPMGDMPPYTEWKLGDESIGGAMDISSMMPAEAPPYWQTYFQVADVDATAKLIVEAGGKLMMEPESYPGGRFAVATDPHGAVFAILQPKQM